MTVSLEDLTAEQLFQMAQQRQAEEQASRQQEIKAQVAALKARRREIEERYEDALAAIDYEILKLTRNSPMSRAKTATRIASIGSLILAILDDKGKATASEIKRELESFGVRPKNLFRAIANLKGKGKVVSASRGVYALAG